jgi:hypothetical protein
MLTTGPPCFQGVQVTNRTDESSESWGEAMRAVVRWLMKHVVLLSLLTAPAAGCSAESDDSTQMPPHPHPLPRQDPYDSLPKQGR